MKNPRPAPRFLPKRSTIAIALALSLGAGSADVFAFGFGEPEVASALGQPLRMRVPLQPDPTVDLSPQCLHLLGSNGPQDALPTLTQARLSIEENGKDRVLRIDSVAPINEPILRIIVDAGCAQHMRREFTILLDPPVPSLLSPALAPAAATLSANGPSNVAPPDSTIATEVGAPTALDLGVARIQGRMGEPLLMQIPITGTAAATLDNSSVRVARVLNSDGTPLRNQAQISLTRTDTTTTLQLITPDAISEPALRVVVEVATPTASVRREYGVLLDLPVAAAKAGESAEPAASGASVGANTTEPLPAAAAAALAQEAKTTPAENQAAAPETTPPPAPPKTHKKTVRHAPKPPVAENLAPAAAPANAAPAEPAHAPANAPAKAEEKPAAKASATPEKSGTSDHLVVSAPDSQADAAAKRFAEMDQRVKELTDEIVRLRADLAAQKLREAQLVQREAELEAQGTHASGNWLLAIVGAIGAAVGVILLWTRRRGASALWNPSSWENTNQQHLDIEPASPQGPGFLARPGASTSAPAAASGAATLGATTKPAPNPATEQPFRNSRKGSSAPVSASGVAGSSDPITISPHTTPIEVTEVLASEPSIEQLYTLFYDIGGNTLPGAVPAPGSNMSLPHTVLPPISLPKSDSLDIDLGIPDSIQSTKSARAQGALKQSPGTLGGATPASKAPATGTRSFTYEDKPASAPGAEPPTGLGPMTEIPRDMEFQVTQPGLDLDLTTNIVPVTNLDALTVMLPQEGEGAGKVATAPVKMAGTTPAQAPVPVPVPAPVPAPAAPPAAGAPRHPVGLELDLTTDIGRGTELGPLTVIPKDDEGPKTRVELDLDLNTNIVPLRSTEEGQDRESDPFAITTIPSAWDKKKPRS